MSATYWVNIDCTDPSHEGRTVHVGTYLGDDGVWMRMPARRRDGSRPARTGRLEGRLADEEREDMHENLVCTLCPRGGAKVSTKPETLSLALSAVADALELGDLGEASIELQTFAAIVSKQH